MPLLVAVGTPSAVNPDTALRAAAEQRDWAILEFQRPVSVGPRVPAPPPKVWIGVAVGMAVAAGIVAVSKRRSVV